MMNSFGKSNLRQPMEGSACTLERSSLFLFEGPGGEGIFVFLPCSIGWLKVLFF